MSVWGIVGVFSRYDQMLCLRSGAVRDEWEAESGCLKVTVGA